MRKEDRKRYKCEREISKEPLESSGVGVVVLQWCGVVLGDLKCISVRSSDKFMSYYWYYCCFLVIIGFLSLNVI